MGESDVPLQGSSNYGQMFTLLTKDKKKLPVKEKALKQCKLFANLFASIKENHKVIPVNDVKYKPLEVVMRFSDLHMDDGEYTPLVNPQENLLSLKDREIFERLDSDLFTEVILAANYVDNQRLIEAGLLYVLYKTRGKTVEEMRALLNLPDDIPKRERSKFNQRHQNRFIYELQGAVNPGLFQELDVSDEEEDDALE